jgi:hypothetical protein
MSVDGMYGVNDVTAHAIVKQQFKHTDSAFVMRLTKGSVIEPFAVMDTAYFPDLPSTRLPRSLVSGLRTATRRTRRDFGVKILCPTRLSNIGIKGYVRPKANATAEVPDAVTLFVVDESDTICKLVFPVGAGEHALLKIVTIFKDYLNSTNKRNVVLILRSVSQHSVDGHAAITVDNLSLFYTVDAHQLHNHVHGKCKPLFLKNDPEVSKGVSDLFTN